MIISLIAAMAQNRVIGVDNKMPWHISADLKYFKRVTTGHPIIMGRKTFESFGAKPLPNRRNMIITRNPEKYSTISQCEFFDSLHAALSACPQNEEVFIIGGEQIYRLALPMAHRVYLTIIDNEVAGDARFPELPPSFKEVKSETGEENGLHFQWKLFEAVSR